MYDKHLYCFLNYNLQQKYKINFVKKWLYVKTPVFLYFNFNFIFIFPGYFKSPRNYTFGNTYNCKTNGFFALLRI